MNDGSPEKIGLQGWWVPIALVHVVCCGGFLLPFIIGSAAMATVTGYLFDPLVQLGGLVVLGCGLALMWWRFHIKRVLHPRQPQVETLDTPT